MDEVEVGDPSVARVAPRGEPLPGRGEESGVVVHERPALSGREDGGDRPQVRARSAAEIDDPDNVMACEAARERGEKDRVAGPLVRGLTQVEPDGRKAAHRVAAGKTTGRSSA